MKHVVTTVGGVVALIKHGLGTLVVTSVTMVDKVDISMVYDQNLMGLNMTSLTIDWGMWPMCSCV